MKRGKIIYILSSLLFVLSSCGDFLDIKDEASINPAIWDDEQSAKLYLNNIYNMNMTSFGGENLTTSLANLSDETSDMSSSILLGTLTSSQISTYSASTYESIRYINVAFEGMNDSKMPESAKNRTLGQLYFYRAWVHWKLINLYGGIPYMKDYVTFTSNDEIRNAPRNSTSECIEYLKQDLDSAIMLLPAAWTANEYARITRAAAAAFKGRVLLFYASPQFNPDNDKNRWKEAFEANVYANQLCIQDGYSLKDVSTAISNKWPYGFDANQIFMQKKSEGNPELLIVTPYYTDIKTHGFENSVCPVELTNNSGAPSLCPTWDLVISYLMKDGSIAFKYDANNKNSRTFIGNGGDINKYYLNRDPRFYSTIAFNGGYYQLEGNTERRQWNFNFTQKNSSIYYSENTTVDKTSPTGFYCRKMVNPSILRANMGKSTTDWVEMRYAEVLLNLAECAFEYEGANSSTGLDCLKKIRTRAGIEPGADLSYGINQNLALGLTPVEIVMNERRIEFAFEGKRFYDLRRRNMFSNNLGNYIYKINGWKKSGSGYVFKLKNPASDSTIFVKNTLRDTIQLDNVYRYFTMSAKSSGPLVKAINYVAVTDPTTLLSTNTGNYNFFDIPQDILTRSPKIKQTIGWQNGEFNPFE